MTAKRTDYGSVWQKAWFALCLIGFTAWIAGVALGNYVLTKCGIRRA